MTTTVATKELPFSDLTETLDPPLLHLVLQNEWPVALCGHNVSERFTGRGAGMDRCSKCLAIARDHQLGRPGWH